MGLIFTWPSMSWFNSNNNYWQWLMKFLNKSIFVINLQVRMVRFSHPSMLGNRRWQFFTVLAVFCLKRSMSMVEHLALSTHLSFLNMWYVYMQWVFVHYKILVMKFEYEMHLWRFVRIVSSSYIQYFNFLSGLYK